MLISSGRSKPWQPCVSCHSVSSVERSWPAEHALRSPRPPASSFSSGEAAIRQYRSSGKKRSTKRTGIHNGRPPGYTHLRRLLLEPLEHRCLLSGGTALADLPVAAQNAISSAIGQEQSAYHAASNAAGVSLTNPANGFTAQVRAGALQVSTGSDTWNMTLMGLDYGGAVQPVGTAQTTANGNRVDCNYGSIDAWYINGPDGLEQGFNVVPLPQSGAASSLTVELALGGDLAGAVNSAASGLALVRPDGSTALRYTGLLAYDAAGRALSATLEVRAEGGRQDLLIHVNTTGAQGVITIDPVVQEAELNVGTSTNWFGRQVAISGNTLVVAAQAASAGYADDAYVFTESGATWSLQATLAKSDATGPLFASSVAISGDTVVVGAEGSGTSSNSNYGPGAVYVYARPGGGWASTNSPTATLTASDGAAGDNFGASVAISGDTVVVGADDAAIGGNSDQGAAYVFTESGSHWTNLTETAKLTADDGTTQDQFGSSVSISANVAVVGAIHATVNGNTQQGAVYLFTMPASGWASTNSPTAKLTSSKGGAYNYFGSSVSISGDTVAVGAYGINDYQGAAYLFTEPAYGWTSMTQTATLTADDGATQDNFGASVSISGNTVLVGAPYINSYQGEAYEFTEPASGWASMTETAKLVRTNGAADDNFGSSVSISGNTVLVGAEYANSGWGAADLFAAPASAGVVAVSTTDSGTIGAGTTVPVTVTFSQAVTVSGTPQLALNDGYATAVYAAGSGGTTLTFNYTVANGQNTADLDYAFDRRADAQRREHRRHGRRQHGLAGPAGHGQRRLGNAEPRHPHAAGAGSGGHQPGKRPHHRRYHDNHHRGELHRYLRGVLRRGQGAEFHGRLGRADHGHEPGRHGYGIRDGDHFPWYVGDLVGRPVHLRHHLGTVVHVFHVEPGLCD